MADPSPHGVGGYKRGCRCDECRAANAKRHRRWKEKARDRLAGKIPHGHGGYVNYDCRCEICCAAHRAMLKVQRARRLARGIAPESRHGMYGYLDYGCRCDICVAGLNLYVARKRRKINNESRDRASRHYQEWTGPELETAARSDLTARDVAAMIGRTVAAVRSMRRKLLHDPRIISKAGVARRQLEVSEVSSDG